ncbi:glutathione S-transferase C-terminal domain-containing protein [uncultured Nitratireductor sp.]|uniref:glutathione S-transferase C-terminal domain-containing protein n=1 Tax=uncultured Nitratireductor sp. TaxID=520953 RepID=UPI0025E79DD1|nr:glutathione S-transferase C-terminal domain-containing protein [uncultured Nitratireductor sp.]
MKLYMTAGACSLADHIALIEADLAFETVEVDIPTRTTKSGEDYAAVNAKGYVPALVMDDDALLTENVAILSWIAEQADHLRPQTPMERTRLIEMLAFIEAEIHKPFIRVFFSPHEDSKTHERQSVERRFDYIAERLTDDFLFGKQFGVADAFLYVMLRWAHMTDTESPVALQEYMGRVERQASVKRALEAEDLKAEAA